MKNTPSKTYDGWLPINAVDILPVTSVSQEVTVSKETLREYGKRAVDSAEAGVAHEIGEALIERLRARKGQPVLVVLEEGWTKDSKNSEGLSPSVDRKVYTLCVRLYDVRGIRVGQCLPLCYQGDDKFSWGQ